ncbi:MAG: uracil-DNA glycosylase family protein [Acidimicrobiia bacterium]
MDPTTVSVYEARAAEWASRRPPRLVDEAVAFAARVTPGALRVDLGCGPGSYLAALGQPIVALDAAGAMLDLAGDAAPGALRVRADLEGLPLRAGSLGGAWARASYLHVPRTRLPLALRQLHQACALDAAVVLTVKRGDAELDPLTTDDFEGRRFAQWEPESFTDVVQGAGFELDGARVDDDWITVESHRGRLLPDTVGPGMRILVAGLNPSLYTADAGVGYARPGNRFWPAALASGLVSRDRDPLAALRDHGVGMTNLVLRATPRADQVSTAEYREGTARVARLVEWLRPGVLCVVGITGWRIAVDNKAQLGLQPEPVGGRPVYVMPNTSGLNAHSKPADYARHFRTVMALADGVSG